MSRDNRITIYSIALNPHRNYANANNRPCELRRKTAQKSVLENSGLRKGSHAFPIEKPSLYGVETAGGVTQVVIVICSHCRLK